MAYFLAIAGNVTAWLCMTGASDDGSGRLIGGIVG